MDDPPQPRRDPATKPPVSANRRRDKPQLSCTMCRRRKLRCDRALPCETCIRRGVALSCAYIHSNPPEKVAAPVNLPQRITQLERLVTSLMSSINSPKADIPLRQLSEETVRVLPPQTPSPPAPEKDQNTSLSSKGFPPLADSFGRISLEKSETTYVESTHWTAILDEIAELKDYFQESHDRGQQQTSSTTVLEPDEPELIFGHCKYMSKQEILATLPPRPAIDRLVAGFFSYETVAPVVVHSPTFLIEYSKFWEYPLDMPLPWIALLFAIISLAVLLQHQQDPTFSVADSMRLMNGYREKVIQCLLLSKYTKCAPYTLETLIVLLHVEHIRSDDSQIEPWVLLGIIIRLALRMGYHRDPSHFPHISAFQGEMRRRAWSLIVQFDALSSSQVGLPRMISRYETAEPGNLLDEDFHKDIATIPQSRPTTFITPIQYVMSKNKLLAVYGTISDLVTSTKLGVSSYPEIMRLDGLLNETYLTLPGGWHTRTMTNSIMDTADTIIRRIYIAVIFQRAKCILHYKYLLPARTDDRYNYSRWTCIEAALQLLDYQLILHQETQAGGRLSKDRWKVSSIVNTSFFLASTLLSLELDYDITTTDPSQTHQKAATSTDTRRRIIEALNNSYLIWILLSDSSREARKAADVLHFVLGKAKKTEIIRQGDMDRRNNGILYTSDSSSRMLRSEIAHPMPDIQSPPPKYIANATAADTPLAPSSIPQLLLLNAGAHIDYSDINIEPSNFELRVWYQTQSLEEFLEMSPNFPALL